MIKTGVRVVSALLIAVCAILGLYTVRFYSVSNSDVGIKVVCLLYEYNTVEDIDKRMDQLHKLCTEQVYDQLSVQNEEHFEAAYSRRSRNYPTGVKVVFDRPGLVVYALDNAVVYPADLWCFEYKIKDGLFSEVREYKLAGWREDDGGGLF